MDHSAKKILALCNEAKECPICHVRFKNNKAFASGCLHCFCYQCMTIWIQRQATCPLCRKPIEYIIKNVKSNNDYDIEEVVPPPNDDSDPEGDIELGASDHEYHAGDGPIHPPPVSDSDSSESDVESIVGESGASEQESNHDVWSSISEHESEGNESDIENHYATDSEHEYYSGMSEGELDTDGSGHESDVNVSASLHSFSSNSDDELNVNDIKSSDDESTSVSALSSSVSDLDSDDDILSSDDQDSVNSLSSSNSVSDYSSSSSDY